MKIKSTTQISYETPGAAGMDLRSTHRASVAPGERKLIRTGVKLAIPEGYEGQIRPRSGLALRHGITVLNTPGTIDSDYRGEIGVILINHGTNTFNISIGDRIAQIVFAKVERAEVEVVSDLDDTQRGGCGFGSTGV